MRNRLLALKLVFFICFVLSSFPVGAQSTVKEMVDKGKTLMIEHKYSEALSQFNNAIVLDPKIQSSIQHYISICNDNIRPHKSIPSAPVFSISDETLDFKGIAEEQTIKVQFTKGDWSANSLEEWCKITVDKAFNEVRVTCDKHFGEVSRKCLISFSHEDVRGNVTTMFATVRQRAETEVLKVKENYIWRNERPDFLMLESTGDLVIVDLDCNTEWKVIYKPKDVEVGNDNGDMTKLVIRIAPIEGAAGAVKLAKKLMGTLERDYITIATVNQDVRYTIQTERYVLGKSQEERKAEKERKQAERKKRESNSTGNQIDQTGEEPNDENNYN